jgi:predicted nucleic acid-binding Zn ribbon protein
VCTEWLNKERAGVHNTTKGFMAFREWALKSGYADNLTLDRIDNDKGYCPENCRWVTMGTQQNNRSNNHIITYNGVTLTMSEWNRKLGYPRGLVEKRLRRGWTVQRALTQHPRVIKGEQNETRHESW